MAFENYPKVNLQLLAEGAGEGTAAGTGATESAAGTQVLKGAKNPLANVQYGIQEGTEPAAEVSENKSDPNAEFEKLIKTTYKEQYDQRVQDTIQKRLKSTKETVDKYNALQPIVEILAKKYGVDASDVDALNKAIEDDDSYFEDEAMERGLSVKQLKEVRAMERENAQLKQAMQEREKQEGANRLYAQWMKQSDETKAVYPTFDLKSELQNPEFVKLLNSSVDVRTAYEVIHKDEILPAAMQFAAKTVESKIAGKIAANSARPRENGISGGSTAVVKSDVSQLTKADRAEIIRRVQRGEKIRF